MTLNSRAKGARAEREFIQQYLRPHWPEACRNLDQYGPTRHDCLNVPAAISRSNTKST